ncbi:MAG: response regulator [Herpetosiphon sp.]
MEQRSTDQVRVLIAEDNELVALTLEEQLITLGYAVVDVAHTGNEAVEMCEATNPDIVLMDMQMPELPGDAAAQEIGERCGKPVIMLTAFSDPEHIRRAEAAGALAYLVKPINIEELAATIDIALARYRDLHQLRSQVEELQESIDARKVIERAVGILMKRLEIGHSESLQRLESRAGEKHLKLREIAQAIVDAEALLT